MRETAAILGITEATMYRKLADNGSFTRKEIMKYKEAFRLNPEEVDAIFFKEKLT